MGDSEKVEQEPQEAATTVQKDQELKNKIETTQEELEYYYAVKSVLNPAVNSSRIFFRDTESYFGILLDDNKLKWICRLGLNAQQKYLYIPDENKHPIRIQISDVDDIYN